MLTICIEFLKQLRIRKCEIYFVELSSFKSLDVSRRVMTKILKFPRNYAYYNSLALEDHFQFTSSLYQSSNRILSLSHFNRIHSIYPHPRQIFQYSNHLFFSTSIICSSRSIVVAQRSQRGRISLSRHIGSRRQKLYNGCVGGYARKGWQRKEG